MIPKQKQSKSVLYRWQNQRLHDCSSVRAATNRSRAPTVSKSTSAVIYCQSAPRRKAEYLDGTQRRNPTQMSDSTPVDPAGGSSPATISCINTASSVTARASLYSKLLPEKWRRKTKSKRKKALMVKYLESLGPLTQ